MFCIKLIGTVALGLVLGCGTATRAFQKYEREGSQPRVEALSDWHIQSLSISPDQKKLATGTGSGWVEVRDFRTGKILHAMKVYDDQDPSRNPKHWEVRNVAWSPDGKLLAAGCMDGSVKIWDSETAALLHNLEKHKSFVNDIAWCPTENLLLTAGIEGELRLWSGEDGKKVWSIQTGKIAPNIASALPPQDFGTLALNAKVVNGGISIGGGAESVAWSPDGQQLAVGIGNPPRVVAVLKAKTGEYSHHLKGSPYGSALAWSPDGTKIAAGGLERSLGIFNASTGERLHQITLLGPEENPRATGSPVDSIAYSPTGEWLAASNGHPGGIVLLNTTTYQISNRIPIERNYRLDIQWFSDDRGFAFVDQASLVLHRLTDGEQLMVKTFLANQKWLAGFVYHFPTGLFSGDVDLFGESPQLTMGWLKRDQRESTNIQGTEDMEALIGLLLDGEALRVSSGTPTANFLFLPMPNRVLAPFDERPLETLGCNVNFSGQQLAENHCFFKNKPPSPKDDDNTLNISLDTAGESFVRLDKKTIYTDDYEIAVRVVNNTETPQGFIPATFGAHHACVKIRKEDHCRQSRPCSLSNAYALKPGHERAFKVRLDYSYKHARGNSRRNFSLKPGCYKATLTLSRGSLTEPFQLCYKSLKR